MRIREGSEADREAILALRRAAFPHDDVEKQSAAFWDWEFASARVFVAEEGGRVVGHLGFVPQEYEREGATVPAMLACDAMVDPAMRRRGVFSALAQEATAEVRRSVPLVVAYQIRKAVLPAMTGAGYRVEAVAPVVLRVTFAMPARSGARETRSDPVILSRGDGEGSQNATDRSLRSFASLRMTKEFVEWRFERNPAWTYAVWREGDAYVVTRDSRLKGILTHCLVDFDGEPRPLRRAIRASIADARKRGVPLTAALVSLAHPHFWTLVRCGYLPGPHRFRFLVHSDAPPAKWALTWASSDHV
jgi:GNAT superfamily N-acetyltransferase